MVAFQYFIICAWIVWDVWVLIVLAKGQSKRILLACLNTIPHTTIIVDGRPYLTRYYLLLRDWKWFNLYLHHFHSSDQGIELHNHPWKWGVSFVLSSGYVEERIVNPQVWTSDSHKPSASLVEFWQKMDPVEVRIVMPRTFNFIRVSDFHRVDLNDEVNGAWTLFVAGPRHPREWGFLDRNTREFKHFSTNPNAIP